MALTPQGLAAVNSQVWWMLDGGWWMVETPQGLATVNRQMWWMVDGGWWRPLKASQQSTGRCGGLAGRGQQAGGGGRAAGRGQGAEDKGRIELGLVQCRRQRAVGGQVSVLQCTPGGVVGSVQEAEGSEGAGVVQCTGGCSSAGGGGVSAGGDGRLQWLQANGAA